MQESPNALFSSCFPAVSQLFFFIGVGVIVCIWQHGGRRAVQSDPGKGRPGVHRERWVLPGPWTHRSKAETCCSHCPVFWGLLPVWGILLLFPSQRLLRSCGTSARPPTTSTASTSPTETSRCGEEDMAFTCGDDSRLICPLVCVSSPAREPVVHIQRKKLRPQINRLWFCKGDHTSQPPTDPLLHTVLRG